MRKVCFLVPHPVGKIGSFVKEETLFLSAASSYSECSEELDYGRFL